MFFAPIHLLNRGADVLDQLVAVVTAARSVLRRTSQFILFDSLLQRELIARPVISALLALPFFDPAVAVSEVPRLDRGGRHHTTVNAFGV